MLDDRTLVGSIAVGVLGTLVALGYAVGTALIRVPGDPGIPFGGALVAVTLVVVPFAVAAGSAYLAFEYRIVSPLVLVAVFAALPYILEWNADQLLVGLLTVGPFVVVAGLADGLVRARFGRLENPPTETTYRAISVGAMAAVVYFGVFALRAAIPLWQLGAGTPAMFPAAVDLPVVLWYVLGVSAVLVGVPVAVNRRFGLQAPAVLLLGYLLVELAFIQPLVAEGAGLVILLLLVVWPVLAVLLSVVAVVEWWLRARRGEYEDDDEDDGEGGRPEFSVEGGLFGDRV